MTIISIEAEQDGGHNIENQSWRTAPWLPGHVVVPKALENAVWESKGYCDLELDEDGKLVNIIPREIPEVPEPTPEPTEMDKLQAQVLYTALVTDSLIQEV